jgi:hypothetical protein
VARASIGVERMDWTRTNADERGLSMHPLEGSLYVTSPTIPFDDQRSGYS